MPKSAHEYFAELAAVAARGELTRSQQDELSLHLADCAPCRQIQREFEELHAPLHSPVDPAMEAMIESSRDRVRSAVLHAVSMGPVRAPMPTRHDTPFPIQSVRRRLVGGASVGLATAAALTLAFWLGTRYEQRTQAAVRQSANASAAAPTTAAAPRTENTVPGQFPDARYAALTNDLRAAKQHAAKLDATLTTKDADLSQSESARQAVQRQLDSQFDELRSTQALLAARTDELNQLQAAKSSDSTTIVALQYQVQDLSEKLKDQKDSLDRERQLLAKGRDIRDIIGARNLHIIDVYDTSPEGTTGKSFARAFYTEGKSLTLYAYDLPARSTENGKFVYAAWGEKNGSKKTVRNLGILLNDDKGQKRWVLNFSDPKVLAEIDSVFVTLERTGTDSEQPSGKRMLTAYLDSQVNHP